MGPMLHAFADELLKTAAVHPLIDKALRASRTPMGNAVRRAALLGAASTGAQTLLEPHAEGEERHVLRRLLAGGAAGAVTGVAFPGWFGRSQMRPEAK